MSSVSEIAAVFSLEWHTLSGKLERSKLVQSRQPLGTRQCYSTEINETQPYLLRDSLACKDGCAMYFLTYLLNA